METQTNTVSYSIDTNDKKVISMFLELGKKYGFFDTYKDGSGNEHYTHVQQIDMLAYASATFDKAQCVALLDSCIVEGKIDMEKFTDVFIMFYIDSLRKNSSLQSELVEKEIATMQTMKSAPSVLFLPEWYAQAKENLGKNGVWLKPFHDQLAEKLGSETDNIIQNEKSNIADILNMDSIRQFVETHKLFFQDNKELLAMVSKENISHQTSIFIYIFETYISGGDTSKIKDLLSEAQRSGNYHAFLVALYNGGIAFAERTSGSHAEIQHKALQNYIKTLEVMKSRSEKITLLNIKRPNILIAPMGIAEICSTLEKNPTMNLGKMIP